jgi:hypothetical protein
MIIENTTEIDLIVEVEINKIKNKVLITLIEAIIIDSPLLKFNRILETTSVSDYQHLQARRKKKTL